MEACQAWDLPLNSEHPITPKVFDIPALIVTGELDPATAPEYGVQNAKHFSDVVHITIPQMAHGESGMENSECLANILSDFVDAGTTSNLDISCVSTMRPPPFRLE
jgi:pimeloyl-ACP methyl ester carboxylesterase